MIWQPETPTFVRVDALGELALRPVDVETDVDLLHAWLTHPKATFWQLLGVRREEIVRIFTDIDRSDSHDAFLGTLRGEPNFLVERYDPAADPVGGTYAVQDGDIGMHFLLAPSNTPVHGFSRAVIRTVVEMLFADPRNHRIVVEPDVRNTAVHQLNAAVGFEVAERVELPDKQALLSFCTREQFAAAVTP